MTKKTLQERKRAIQERDFNLYRFKVEVMDTDSNDLMLKKLFISKASAQAYIDRFAVRYSFTRKAPFRHYKRNLGLPNGLGYDRGVEYILKENLYL